MVGSPCIGRACGKAQATGYQAVWLRPPGACGPCCGAKRSQRGHRGFSCGPESRGYERGGFWRVDRCVSCCGRQKVRKSKTALVSATAVKPLPKTQSQSRAGPARSKRLGGQVRTPKPTPLAERCKEQSLPLSQSQGVWTMPRHNSQVAAIALRVVHNKPSTACG